MIWKVLGARKPKGWNRMVKLLHGNTATRRSSKYQCYNQFNEPECMLMAHLLSAVFKGVVMLSQGSIHFRQESINLISYVKKGGGYRAMSECSKYQLWLRKTEREDDLSRVWPSCFSPLVFLFPKSFKSFCLCAYLMKVIPETCRAH